MTLILALANEEFVVQISDRRLSCNGKVKDDESNKSGFLITDDSQILFGFTGLAEFRSFKTRRWILETLASSKDTELREVIEKFRVKSSEYFNSNNIIKRLPPEQRRLSIMFTGFHQTGLVVSSIITNYQNFKSGTDSSECFDEFQDYSLISHSPDVTFIPHRYT